MLNFILGGAKSLKTEFIYNNIKNIINSETNKKILLIVPDQISFATECFMYDFIGAQKSRCVEVLSFKWLCNLIFREYGGLCNEYATNSVKAVLMLKSISKLYTELNVYNKNYKNVDFIKSMIKIINDFKINGIYPKDFDRIIDKIDNILLKEKIRDINIIYTFYNNILTEKYQDSGDELNIAADLIKSKKFFSDYIVFFDEFDRFTGAQYSIIQNMLKNCDDIYMGLRYCISDERNFFNYTKFTYNKLKLLSNKSNTSINVINLDENNPEANHSLGFLDKNIFSNNKYVALSSDITISVAKNNYQEINYIASTIFHLVKNENYRYKDIILITRDVNIYKNLIKDIFETYEIPIFMDVRTKLKDRSVIKFIVSFLKVLISNFDTNNLIDFLKNRILAVDSGIVNKLDNYIHTWSIDNNSWKKEFTLPVKGFGGKDLTEDDINCLNDLNEIRRYVVDIILYFKKKVKNKTGKEYIKYLYEVIKKFNIEKNVEEISNDLYKKDINMAKDYLKSYEILIDILDILYDNLDDTKLTLDKFFEYFMLVVDNYEIGQIPQCIDSVLVCQADRSIYSDVKISFLIGLNYGLFPLESDESSILNKSESDELIGLGLEFVEHTSEFHTKEEFILYKALSSCSDKLYISYSNVNQNKESLKRSTIIDELINTFGKNILLNVQDLPLLYFCTNVKNLYNQIALNYKDDTQELASMIKVVNEIEIYKNKVLKLENVILDNNYKIYNSELTKQFFGENIILSPSKIENFYRCKFRYFCKYGMNVHGRKKAEFNPMETGIFMHYILHSIISKNINCFSNLSKVELESNLKKLFKNYLDSVFGGKIGKSERFLYMYNKTMGTVLNVLEHIQKEMNQSKFLPSDFELSIGFRGDIEPLKFDTDLGNIWVEGVVDRVDLLNIEDRSYVRIVDYKSSGKEFSLSDIYYGLNLQMLIYLFSIVENGKNKYEKILPAGVLYMPVNEKYVSSPRLESKDKVEKIKLASYKMNGILLDNIEVIDAMDNGVTNLFVNAKLKKNGELDVNKSIVSNSEINILRTHIEKMIKQMATSLQFGDISARASTDSKFRYCSMCEYNTVCGKMQDNKDLIITPKNFEDFIVKGDK